MLQFVHCSMDHRGSESPCDSTRSRDWMPPIVRHVWLQHEAVRDLCPATSYLTHILFMYALGSCQKYDSDGARLCHSIAIPHNAWFAGGMWAPCASTTHWFHRSFIPSDTLSFFLSFIHSVMHSSEAGSGAICSGCSFITFTKERRMHESTHLEDTRYKMERFLPITRSVAVKACALVFRNGVRKILHKSTLSENF